MPTYQVAFTMTDLTTVEASNAEEAKRSILDIANERNNINIRVEGVFMTDESVQEIINQEQESQIQQDSQLNIDYPSSNSNYTSLASLLTPPSSTSSSYTPLNSNRYTRFTN